MKNFALLVILAFAMSHLHGQGQPTTTPEQQAVQAAIQAELNGFLSCNHTNWSAQWVQDPQTTLSVSSEDGDNSILGWTQIDQAHKAYFDAGTPASFTVVHSDHNIRVNGNMAFVNLMATITEGTEVTKEPNTLVLEQIDGVWKILYKSRTVRSLPPTPQHTEDAINLAAYLLLEQKDTTNAINTFNLNTQIYPSASTAYENLGAIYKKQKNPTKAIENFQKATALNPNNTNAQRMLKELQQN